MSEYQNTGLKILFHKTVKKKTPYKRYLFHLPWKHRHIFLICQYDNICYSPKDHNQMDRRQMELLNVTNKNKDCFTTNGLQLMQLECIPTAYFKISLHSYEMPLNTTIEIRVQWLYLFWAVT